MDYYDPTNEADLSRAMELAMSPAGKQLMELLRQNNALDLQNALEKASRGDYADARRTINAFLETPEAQNLLKQLRDTP